MLYQKLYLFLCSPIQLALLLGPFIEVYLQLHPLQMSSVQPLQSHFSSKGHALDSQNIDFQWSIFKYTLLFSYRCICWSYEKPLPTLECRQRFAYINISFTSDFVTDGSKWTNSAPLRISACCHACNLCWKGMRKTSFHSQRCCAFPEYILIKAELAQILQFPQFTRFH